MKKIPGFIKVACLLTLIMFGGCIYYFVGQTTQIAQNNKTVFLKKTPKHASQAYENFEHIREINPDEFSQPFAQQTTKYHRINAKIPIPAKSKPLVKKPTSTFYQAQVISAGVIQFKKLKMTITGIKPTPTTLQCSIDTGKSLSQFWPCGALAKLALQRFIRGRAITCENRTIESGKTNISKCFVGKKDIGQWLARWGWVHVPIGSQYYELHKKARRARLGIFKPTQN